MNDQLGLAMKHATEWSTAIAGEREGALASVWPGHLDVDPHHGQCLVHHGYTVLLSNPDGTIGEDGRQGLFDHDTRVLSRYEMVLDGMTPRVDSTGLIDSCHWIGRLTAARSGGDARGPRLPQDAFELTLRRAIGNGMLETIDIDNHSAAAACTTFAIRLDADFCDVAEVGGPRQLPGSISGEWDARNSMLTIDYRASHDTRNVHRAIRIRVLRADSEPNIDERTLRFDLRLPPHGSWHAEVAYEFLVDDRWLSPLEGHSVLIARQRFGEDWRRERAHVESTPSLFGSIVERAADDLWALRNWDQDAGPDAWVPHAGMPTYTGLFGRDVLTAGLQAALIGPDLLRGAIASLAATQGDADSAWHDEEPGKMIHEMRRGPLSEIDLIPQRHYYGTQTASSFFVVTLSELWHWTGDTDMLRTYLTAALRTFEWADRYGDCDGDGFLEYRRRSARGLKNHGWKDSDEAIRYPDGGLVENPIATVEEQAYHWLALRRMAETLLAVGDEAESARFLARARRLRAAWHEAFWSDEDGFYAMALDPAKRPVRSIGSNAGHALAAGLIPATHARRVADRLMADDLFSGWGIRSLSSDHPSYNPLAYHLGAVWPVENATIALGFKRYGLDAHADRLITAMFAAADRFRHSRLPEALGGHPREGAAVPTVYPASNSPQAWSASATIQMAQTLLGLYPFAPAHVVAFVRPALPAWLNSVIVRNLHVGTSRVSIRFERARDGTTTYETFDRRGPLHVIDVPPPQAEGGWRDALAKWILEHVPGKTAAALRIAIGDDE
ncbi:MAG TPA: glycogen debranching N-terminal domain-containing protein [Vicinamibacterales bacterium]|nr:glycogen debranching N-terminal domain-containing protein [Vicinamibacterales bacterium]